ncbi:MAG TPA: hypothetical protein VME70_10965 [Mycobacteriales bacterium]|nr:hypothetical protein [Mycobacteriales bacterium]
MRRPTVIRRSVAVIAITTAAGAGICLASTPLLAHPSAPHPAPRAFSATKWHVISSGNIKTTGTTPSIARFGKNFEVVWASGIGTTWALHARILDAAGKPLGAQINVLPTNWSGVALDPTILSFGGKRTIAFGGSKTGTSGPYDTNAEYMTTSSDGKSWSLFTGSLSADDGASNGSTAVIADGSDLAVGLARSDGVAYHIGVPSSADPQSGPDPVTKNTGNFSYDPGLGKDEKSGDVWALWYSNSNLKGKDGVEAQMISPSKGLLLHGPGSSTSSNTSAGVQQDLPAVQRSGGGIYTAYRIPDTSAIDVWKVGASKPVAKIHDAAGADFITMAAGPGGRLWLFWTDGQGWRATRSNKAATKFGPVLVSKIPGSYYGHSDVAADGAAGPLEAVAVVANAKNVDEIEVRQFLPKLTVKVSPHSVAGGKKFTVKVTDAGDAVKGATVHFDGAKKKTSKHGTATFKAAHKKGTFSVTVSLGGYTGASTTVHIT